MNVIDLLEGDEKRWFDEAGSDLPLANCALDVLMLDVIRLRRIRVAAEFVIKRFEVLASHHLPPVAWNAIEDLDSALKDYEEDADSFIRAEKALPQ